MNEASSSCNPAFRLCKASVLQSQTHQDELELWLASLSNSPRLLQDHVYVQPYMAQIQLTDFNLAAILVCQRSQLCEKRRR